MRKNIIIVNANDPQIVNLVPYIESLLDPARGNFKGDLVVVTTEMSPAVKKKLSTYGVKIFENKLDEVLSADFAQEIGAYEIVKREVLRPELFHRIQRFIFRKFGHPLEKKAKRLQAQLKQKSKHDTVFKKIVSDEFELYHRKHFTKLNAYHYWKSIDSSNYTSVLLTDADMIFQNDVSSLFDVIEHNDGYFYYEDEMVPLLRCPRFSEGSVHVIHSHEIAEKTKYKNDLKFGEGYSECNVGIVGIKSVYFEKWITEWKSLMWDSDLNWLFTADPLLFWHEQDFFRLQRDINDKDAIKFGKNLVYHAVGAMGYEIEEVGDMRYRTKSTKVEPTIVHFAGGSWKRFPKINERYSLSSQELVNA